MIPVISRTIFGLFTLAALLFTTPAWACGGFFCNLSNPLNQAAERVLYIQNGADITVHIQIKYQGPSSKFSWVLPLQSVPKLTTGSDAIFAMLENYTRPTFQLEITQGDATCHFPQCAYPMSASEGDGAGGGVKNAGGGVTVLQEAKVGPYETKVIQGDTGAELQKWLSDNGYDQPAATAGLLDAYAKEKFVFLALKLQKDKAEGDLVPIAIQMKETSPCLPIRLTQLAANPDMPVVIWTLGPARAVPKNWLHVELNFKTVNWFTGGDNYVTVASKAIDQASGHAFTTEFAQKTKDVQMQFAPQGWNEKTLANSKDAGKFLETLMQQIGSAQSGMLQPIIKKYIPKPTQFADKSDQEFYGCVQQDCCYDAGKACQSGYQCYGDCGAMKKAVAEQSFDPAGMAAEIASGIVQPLLDMQKAYAKGPWLTRLMTLVSPEEMNKDPIFAWNPDLPAVSNQHTAKASPLCLGSATEAVRAKMTLADGSTWQVPLPAKKNEYDCPFYGYYGLGYGANGTPGPVVAEGGQPAQKVQVLDEQGAPIAIDPSSADMVDAALDNAKVGTPSLNLDFIKKLPPVTWQPDVPTNSVGQQTTSSGGCNAGTQAQAGGALSLLVLGGLLLRRRRVFA